jgi:hypothetical protein
MCPYIQISEFREKYEKLKSVTTSSPLPQLKCLLASLKCTDVKEKLYGNNESCPSSDLPKNMANVTQKSSDLPKNMANVTQKSM